LSRCRVFLLFLLEVLVTLGVFVEIGVCGGVEPSSIDIGSSTIPDVALSAGESTSDGSRKGEIYGEAPRSPMMEGSR
jgi:hypothetical protein